jgi:CRISPR-associated protein Csa1
VHFPSQEERKNLIKGILPKARRLDVAEDLRGWNWHRPPLAPIFEVRLALHEVADHYCPTGRNVYLAKVEGVKATPTYQMMEGIVLHNLLNSFIIQAKKLIYACSPDTVLEALTQLGEVDFSAVKQFKDQLDKDQISLLSKKASVLWNFELTSLKYRIQETLSKQRYIGVDSLISMALPVTVEQKLDGSFLGLSKHLSADASGFFETVIYDVKFGTPMNFHKLTTTGYAMVMEAVYDFPITCGCIIYANFAGGRLLVEREYHLIDDELRQWFIEARDEKARIVSEEIDPGKPDQCYENCMYREYCG